MLIHKKIYNKILVVAIFLIAAGCDKNSTPVNPIQNNPAATQNSVVQPPVTTNQNKETKPIAKECTEAPATTEIGRDVYPIAEKYKHLQFLGQLFTASDCSSQRLSKIFGVKGDEYTQGALITLNAAPSVEFLSTLKTVGFICSEQKSESTCIQWQLDKTVKVLGILKLKPYANEIKQDDCYICG